MPNGLAEIPGNQLCRAAAHATAADPARHRELRLQYREPVLFRNWDQPLDVDWPAVTELTDHVGVPHLVVTRYDVIKRVLADTETFRPDNALDAITPMPVTALRILAGHGFRLPPTLANNGHLSHRGIRDITLRAMHPTRVEQLRPWMTEVVGQRVAELARRLAAGAQVDLYAELAADLPLLVLARLVELPQADLPTVKHFSRSALELFWGPVDRERQLELADTVGRFHALLREFAQTAGGMVGELREYAREHSLPADTPVGVLFFMLVAGQETTSQFLTLLMHRLTSEPAVLAGIADCTVEVADVVEEGLRLLPPISTWRRVTIRDTELDGVPVPAGRSVLLWLARAARDVVERPADFVPGQRGSRRHLSFGSGAHRCVGAQLARMESSVVVSQTASLLAGVQVVREPWCPDNLSFRMPDSLIVASRP